MIELDEIYNVLRSFYSEYVRNTKDGKEQKLKERSENVFITISLGISGTLIILLFDYKETLQGSFFSIASYDFNIFPLFMLLFLINSLFVMSKVFFLSTRLFSGSERMKIFDEVYLPIIFGYVFIFFAMCLVILYVSIIYKKSLIFLAYAGAIILLIVFYKKIFPTLKLKYYVSKISAYIDRPSHIIVPDSGVKFNYIIENNSKRNFKKNEIEIFYTIPNTYEIEIERVKRINEGNCQLLRDINKGQISIIPVTISRKQNVEEEIIELRVESKKDKNLISKLSITLYP